METLKEERLSITLFKDSNVTICFFCTQKHEKTGGKQTHANRNVERGYDLHPASRLSSKSGDLLRTHENKHLLASGLVACDRRHLWVDVKSDPRAPVSAATALGYTCAMVAPSFGKAPRHVTNGTCQDDRSRF